MTYILINCFFQNSSTDFYGETDNFEKQIVKHMIVPFSVLELHLTTKEHVYGAFVVHLLGINRIRSVMQRLKVNLQKPAVNSLLDLIVYLSNIECSSSHNLFVLGKRRRMPTTL
jgi:hypothetical protein